jgi:hypothetical protein
MRRPRVKCALFVVTLLSLCRAPELAAAERWVAVARTENVAISVDARSITAKDGVLRAWEKWEYSVDRPGTSTTGHRAYRSARFFTYYHCGERASAEMQAVFYDASGEVVGRITEDPKITPLTYVVPGLLSESTLNFVCKAKVQSSPKSASKKSPSKPAAPKARSSAERPR